MKTITSLPLLLLLVSSLQAGAPTNIILILADGINRDLVGCYGANSKTSSIDFLAEHGTRYETAWSMPTHAASQVTLLTGRYPFRDDIEVTPDLEGGNGGGLNVNAVTIAKMLKSSGYVTAAAGIWSMTVGEHFAEGFTHYGFDRHCLWTHADKADLTSNLYRRVQLDGEIQSVQSASEEIHTFINKLMDQAKQKPFFVYCSMLKLTASSSVGKEGVGQREMAPIRYVDRFVGELVESLDQKGLTDNTLIVFTSASPLVDSQPTNRVQGAKSHTVLSDRTVHVPFVVRAPFLTKGGNASRDLIDFTDLFPTLLEVAGIEPPMNVELDGRSFLPGLKGSVDPFEKRSWIYSQFGETWMIRDWEHILDSAGNFHDLLRDPLQQEAVSPLDKQAPGRRQRLEMILKRLPAGKMQN